MAGSIKREDVASMDFSEIAAGERIEPITPGDVLVSEFLERTAPAAA